MATNTEVDLAILWTGHAVADERDHLVAPDGRFLLKGVRPGDFLTFQASDGSELFATVLQVNTDQLLVYQPSVRPAGLSDFPDDGRSVGPGGPVGSTDLPSGDAGGRTEPPSADAIDIPPGEYVVRVCRYVKESCPICAKSELVRDIDHMHCAWCQKEIPLKHETVNCPSCIAWMRQRLVKEPVITQEMSLFGGRRKIRLHMMTVMESDQVQEYQEGFIIANPMTSTGWVFEETRKAQIALMLDDVGDGEGPRSLLVEDPMRVAQDGGETQVLVKFFKGMNQGLYRAIVSTCMMLEALVTEAARCKINDELADDELLALAEECATNIEPVYGMISIFDGTEALGFVDPTVEMIEEADNWTEEFKQRNQNRMLEGRYNFIKAMSRLAASFRRDSKASFGPDSTHKQRLGYLMKLPHPYYYTYLTAANVFQRRIAKASEVQVLGNF